MRDRCFPRTTTRNDTLPAGTVASSLRPAARLVALGLLLAFLSVAASARAADPGPDRVDGSRAVGSREVRVHADGRAFDALTLYPAAILQDPAGTTDDAPIAAGSWPVVIFAHGYLAPVELYRDLLQELAAAGHVVIAPRSGGELLPDHAAYAADVSTVIDWLTVESADPTGWLAGAVDLERIAASGHSMGGGATLLATATDPRIRTVATLAAAETSPSAIEAATRIRVPTLLIAAELDAITPVAAHQAWMYEALTDAPAQLRTILGGSHCGFTQPMAGDLLVGITQLVCDTGTIPRDTQGEITVRLLRDWLLLHLGGAVELWPVVWPDQPRDGTTVAQRRP